MNRDVSTVDRVIARLDQCLRVALGPSPTPARPNPSASVEEAALGEEEREAASRLMRVNHVGEICAQALYEGQGLTARDAHLRDRLRQSASEENDHLAWTAERVRELGGRPSALNPVWYAGSLALGALAGLAGDRWSLGFLAETERQVVEHLEGHLVRLPAADQRSRAIVAQMRDDEAHHATVAIEAGAHELPAPIKMLMRAAAKMMTTTAYWI